MQKTYHFSIFYAKKKTALTLGDTKFQMHKQDLILTRQNIPYTYAEDSVVTFFFKEADLDELFMSQIGDCRIFYEFLIETPLKQEHLYFRTSSVEDVQHYMFLLSKQYKRKGFQRDKLVHLLLVGLLTTLDMHRQTTLIVQNSTMISSNRFGKIMKYIGDHYATCTLAEVADTFGYHPDYLSQRFKMITGVTFSEKLLAIRLEEATHLLDMCDMRIEDIASTIGFKDKSWFIHKFKEVYHTTPGNYRKQVRAREEQ